MAKTSNWKDEYWLFIMQLYLRRPVGVKPVFSRDVVDVALETHVHPRILHNRLRRMAKLDTPRIERFWKQYADKPKRLTRAVRLLRERAGYGNATEFYEGVELNETFERDFRPLSEDSRFTPVAIILVLDLYFRLTPQTMVSETPEVQELAVLLHVTAADVVEVLDVLQHIDPYLNRREVLLTPLIGPCSDIWRRYGNADTNQLAQLADELKEYYK